MKISTFKALLSIIFFMTLSNCVSQKSSYIIGSDYNKTKDITTYFSYPYGSIQIPGKWEKGSFNASSREQSFVNKDGIMISIAMTPTDKYPFNLDGKLTGYAFVKEFYDWESKYFMESFGLQCHKVERDSKTQFIIFQVEGEVENQKVDNVLLFGVKQHTAYNLSVKIKQDWSTLERIIFLKNLHK
ncbi:hypothetical protein OAT16_05390 [Prolixibacteraceae bacterium]|nr:hypothetical protein [Prolixibacteraceae bacterium]